ncbi:MAG: type I-C CRISPR-associated protein Cas5c [Chloroflexota bacterium]
MLNDYPSLDVRVWGDLACFTRPEMKVERVSYPAPTPSAARGILEAIFWKPQFDWRVQEIWVLNPINYFSVLRNEVNSKASRRAAARWEKQGGHYVATDDRAQRHTLALRDVDYVIRAQMELKPGVRDHPAKFRDQFRRRVRKGRCFSRPYLGCREFAARFAEPAGDEQPLNLSMDIGRMLLDLDYDSDGRGTPHFFTARLENGVLHVPARPWKEA